MTGTVAFLLSRWDAKGAIGLVEAKSTHSGLEEVDIEGIDIAGGKKNARIANAPVMPSTRF
jgi:hypothetical protein